ncbi:MAG: hypothetical protein R6U32_02520, partial [Candidatus Woesearchaeota archaeon]
YASKTIPLSFETSRDAECEYSLNNKGYTSILTDTNEITGKEGHNTLSIRCDNTTASTEFNIKLKEEQDTVFDEMKGGDEEREDLFSSMKDKGEEMKLTKQQAREVISEAVRTGALDIRKTSQKAGDNSIITFRIRNTLPISLNSTRMRLNIPKSAAQSAGEISSTENFTVIEDDPVISFLLNMGGDSEETLSIEVPGIIDEETLSEISAETEGDMDSLMRKQTGDAAKITKEFEEFDRDGEKYTRIRTRISPSRELKGMALIEEIPKCLAEKIDEIEMKEKYRSMIKVLKDDPLVMWRFEDNVDSEKEFSYEVRGALSDDCKKQIRAMGIAEELGLDLGDSGYLKIILPLMIIPLIGFVVVSVHRFRPQKKKDRPAKKPRRHEEKKEGNGPAKPVKSFEEEIDEDIEETEKDFEESLRK